MRIPRLRYIGILFCFCFIQTLYAQNQGMVSGQVWDSRGAPASGARVSIDATQKRTDSLGQFTFTQVQPGLHELKVHLMGHRPFSDTLDKHALEALHLEIRLISESQALQEVQVTGKSENLQIRQQPIRTLVLDTRAVSAQANSLTELMNQHTGIRIRQSGGTGSQPEISINGFQGRSIQYFKDGIPLNYLGEGYNIASLPLEALERVEVYKGVLPVTLGADALGGAVNFVSRKPRGSSLNAYYEIGSFNTHRLGVKGHRENTRGNTFVGGELYYTHAGNDYTAEVGVVDPDTRNIDRRRLPLFHNGFEHYFGSVYAGLKNRPWAEELRIGLAGFALKREQQHPALMTDPYGAVESRQKTIAPSIRYKMSLLNGRLSTDNFVAYNDLESQRIDTLMGKYDWYGRFTPGTTRGETRLPSLSEVHEKQWTGRSSWVYDLSPENKLSLNYVLTQADRSGEDPYGPRLDGTDIDVLTLPSMYRKLVLGLSWDGSFWQGRLQQQLIGKAYHYKAEGVQNTWFSGGVTEADRRSQQGQYWGAAEALKYQISPKSLLRTALEFAYRLPQRDELFGNNVFIVPNFELDPERSLNVNLGYEYRSNQGFFAGLNAFYRRTRNMILLVPIQAPNAQFQNQEHIKGYGVDLDVSYGFTEQYNLSGNASWQNLRLFGITDLNAIWKNQARLRNTPYFFSNLEFKAKYKNVFAGNDNLNLFLHYNFMREFYLETIPKDLEPGGFLGLSGHARLKSELIIPNQHTLNFRSAYRFAQVPIQLGLSVRNILDADVFDYYRIPRPGRSIHLKLSYQLKQNNK